MANDDRPHETIPADPDAMREFARALKADARELTDVWTGVRSALRSMEFEGDEEKRRTNLESWTRLQSCQVDL